MGFFTKFFGRTASEGAAFALGTAVGPALSPAVRELVNVAWQTYPSRPLDVGTLTAIVAEDVELLAWGQEQAAMNGVNTERFDAAVKAVRTAPDIAVLWALWRRNLIAEADFTHGLRKAKIEPRWDDALKTLRVVLLSPENLAMMRQQGFIDQARQYEESALQGVDNERAELLFETSGLPPGIETGLEMLRRSIIDETVFGQIVREGHTKTKYTADLLALRHPVLSASQAATLHLKGYIDAATMNALGALTGYTPEQMNRIYLSQGRPAAPGQMWTAAARGIDGPDGVPVNEAQFTQAIRESDIKPKYAPMLWGIRFSYPPLFQINRLVQAGAIDTATAVEWAHKDRYAPEVVTALRAYWERTAAAPVNKDVAKAQVQLWGTVHRSFLAGESTATEARATLTRVGIPGSARDEIMSLWTAERALIRKQLTPAQIKKAYRKASRNFATGAAWTLDDALGALVERGYSLTEANDYLDIP